MSTDTDATGLTNRRNSLDSDVLTVAEQTPRQVKEFLCFLAELFHLLISGSATPWTPLRRLEQHTIITSRLRGSYSSPDPGRRVLRRSLGSMGSI